MTVAIKFVKGSKDLVEGLAIPFGSPSRLDLDGEFFDKSTDLALDWFTDRPFLYDHGTDPGTKTSVVGRVTEYEVRDEGVWAKTQLDRSHRYHAYIADLVGKGALGYSSGAMAHLVQKDQKTGHLERWPWVELSGTPTPASPDAWPITYAVKSSDAYAHLAAVAYDEASDATKTSLEPGSYTQLGQQVTADLSDFIAMTQERLAIRGKAGRVLSVANRELLAAYLKEIDAVSAKGDEVRALLRSTDPSQAKAALAAFAEFAAIEAGLHGVI